MIVAIDGPAGSGKSTIARLIAQKLGFLYIDTGAMYRALTLKILREKADIQNTKQLIGIARDTSIDIANDSEGAFRIFLDGKDITGEIRQLVITKCVSDVAKIKEIRSVMLELERTLGRKQDSVLDGRDIGTVVFPDADKKFYLDADFKERVKRRFKELKDLGEKMSSAEVETDIRRRDTIDSTRKTAPLKKAEDAIYIDTTNMTIDEVVKEILKNIKNIV